ncbi:MAG: hypothetical protein GYB67_14745 [Chloroflexi bacterium]|nr:hypothetical protein [Chloroflexota bacterium]
MSQTEGFEKAAAFLKALIIAQPPGAAFRAN